MPIETERLNLRLFSSQDFQVLRELDSDPAVLRYRSRKSISPEMTNAFLQEAQQAHHQVPRTFFAYAITRKKDFQWLGQCGMTTVPTTELHDRHVFLWYSLLPRYWGFGYMTEAVSALIYVGIMNFGLTLIEGECDPENVPSAKVMERVGLSYQGEIEREDRAGKLVKRRHYEINAQAYKRAYKENKWTCPGVREPY